MHKACHIATRILTTWPNTGPTNVSKSKKPTHQFTNYLGTKVKTCLNAAVKAKTVLRQYLSHGEVICRDHPKMNVLLNGLFTSWPNLCAVFPWKPGKLNFGASAVRPEHSLDFASLRAVIVIYNHWNTTNTHDSRLHTWPWHSKIQSPNHETATDVFSSKRDCCFFVLDSEVSAIRHGVLVMCHHFTLVINASSEIKL